MRAQLLQSYGDKPDFKLADIPKPEVVPGQVLVRIAATSVNPIDLKIRKLGLAFAPALPAILGMDMAGTVEAVGEGVTDFSEGDAVYGWPGGVVNMPGCLAEYVLADPRLIAKKPEKLSFVQAAALPLVTLTAWEALFDRAGVASGRHVLIHAGTGGVGHVAVQLAKAFGARVATTVSSSEKAKIAETFGPDEIINYQQESVEEYVARLTGNTGFDMVFDTVGGTNLDASLTACCPRGVVASTNTRSTHDLSPMHAKGLTLAVIFSLLPLLTGQRRERCNEILTEAARLADAGKLHPLLAGLPFPLEDVAAAHDFLDSGKAVGKVVVEIG